MDQSPQILKIAAHGNELLRVRDFLTNQLKVCRSKEDETRCILLGVQEVLTNIIRYAYPQGDGDVEIRFCSDAEKIQIIIRDYGAKFDPTKIPCPELPPNKPGGLGVFIIKQVMDEFFYDPYIERGNRIVLTKYRRDVAKG